ncbi:MAG: hypothetical protein ACR2GO_05855 [Candidatus Limnocylindria bacterium]
MPGQQCCDPVSARGRGATRGAAEPTANPCTHHLAIDIATFAERWNAELGDGPHAITEVGVTDSETERSFVLDVPDWLGMFGRALAHDRVRSIQVSAETELAGGDPASALADTKAIFAAVIGIVDPSLSVGQTERVLGELHLETLDWHPDDPNPEVHFRLAANGVVYHLTGSGFPE